MVIKISIESFENKVGIDENSDKPQFLLFPTKFSTTSKEKKYIWRIFVFFGEKSKFIIYFISEILEFPSVIKFDIITSDDINFHFHFLP